jgi:outer membrane biosynthesis protein TonB
MRKFILIAAMVLTSAAAQAGGVRSLTLASSDQPAVSEQPRIVEQKTVEQKIVEQKPVEQKPVETPKAVEVPAASEAPKFVARPAPVGTAVEAPKAEASKPVAEKTTPTTSTDKPKRRRESVEARVIRELHRHGIYW